MLRLWFAILLQNEAFLRQTIRRDDDFHELPPSIATATLNDDRMCSSVPDVVEIYADLRPKFV